MTLLYVDGNHMASRARFCNEADLRTSDGRPSGVIVIFLRTLCYAMSKLGYSYRNAVVFWDGGRSQRRLAIYPDYKKRNDSELTEEELQSIDDYRQQITALHENFLPLLGINTVRVQGVEADDLIAFGVNYAVSKGGFIEILSGDRDFDQLVGPHVWRIDSDLNRITPEDVRKKWGCEGQDIVILRSMIGDSSDNIKGVQGVGEGRAPKLLQFAKDVLSCKEVVVEKPLVNIKSEIVKSVDVIRRNIALMSLYNPHVDADEVAPEAARNWLSTNRDLLAYAKLCRSYEIDESFSRML